MNANKPDSILVKVLLCSVIIICVIAVQIYRGNQQEQEIVKATNTEAHKPHPIVEQISQPKPKLDEEAKEILEQPVTEEELGYYEDLMEMEVSPELVKAMRLVSPELKQEIENQIAEMKLFGDHLAKEISEPLPFTELDRQSPLLENE